MQSENIPKYKRNLATKNECVPTIQRYDQSRNPTAEHMNITSGGHYYYQHVFKSHELKQRGFINISDNEKSQLQIYS